MTSFAGKLLLESVVVPAVIAGFLVFPTRWFSHRVSLFLVSATAISAAIATTYLMMFGWPVSEALGARQKIGLLTLAGLLLSIGHSRKPTRLAHLLPALSVLGPLWIGWPALMQGHPTSILLALPIGAGLWIGHRSMTGKDKSTELCLTVTIMAIGLALMALFARTLSMTQLSLALAATLGAIVLVGPKPPDRSVLTAGTTMLIGLASAIMLYSDVSLPAILVLGCILAITPLRRIIMNQKAINNRPWLSLLIAMALVTLSTGIAWIDAGSISIY